MSGKTDEKKRRVQREIRVITSYKKQKLENNNTGWS